MLISVHWEKQTLTITKSKSFRMVLLLRSYWQLRARPRSAAVTMESWCWKSIFVQRGSHFWERAVVTFLQINQIICTIETTRLSPIQTWWSKSLANLANQLYIFMTLVDNKISKWCLITWTWPIWPIDMFHLEHTYIQRRNMALSNVKPPWTAKSD